MQRLIRSRLTVTKAALALALFLAIGGVAYAASGTAFVGPHGMINTCVPPKGGEVNVWKPGHRCSGGRVALAWPARAQNGAPGAPGATGSTGATGATGPTNPAATTVDGETVTKLLLKQPTPTSGSSSQTLYTADGLTILAACASTGTASLQANGPASADSELTVSGFQGTGGAAFGSQVPALGPASLAALGPAGSGESSFSYANSAGQVISGQIGYQSAPSLGSSPGCAFFGVVTSG
jgi:hypothetical protein